MHICLISIQAPEDPRNGRDLRLWSLLHGGDVGVICLDRKARGTHGIPLQDPLPWLEITAINDSSPPNSQARLEALAEAVDREVSMDTTVLVSGSDLAHAVLRRSSRPIVADLCDSMALYHWRRCKSLRQRDPLRALANACYAARSLRCEIGIAQRAGLTMVSSPVDAACLRRFAPRALIQVVGNGTKWLSSVPPRDEDCHRERLVIHGAFEWYPNQAAVEYLTTVVWPKIRARAPSTELHIVGPGLPLELCKLCERQGAVVRGFVDDIFEAVATSGIYVAPMVAGSGVKNKIMEAMAAGVPVVTNTMGAEALPPNARQAIAVCDSPQDFAECVHNLTSSPARWSDLRQTTRKAAEESFDWRCIQDQFESLVINACGSQCRLENE